MEYRIIGSTGLKVSILTIGTEDWTDPTHEDEYFDYASAAIHEGINCFDTAESYGNNDSEKILGNIIKRLKLPRQDFVVMTKIFHSKGLRIPHNPNTVGLSRKHIIEGTMKSIERLNIGHIDVLLCYRPDPDTPMEETCRAMDWLIRAGKIFYWGTSEWGADEIHEAYDICNKYELTRPCVEQCQYNMLARERVELEYSKLFKEYKMGSTVYGAFCGGFLSGKYMNGVAEDSRFGKSEVLKAIYYDPYMSEDKKKKTIETLKSLQEIGASLNASLTQLALAWTLNNPDVSTTIISFSKMSQFEENLKAMKLYPKLTHEIEERIEKALENKPKTKIDYKSWANMPPRR